MCWCATSPFATSLSTPRTSEEWVAPFDAALLGLLPDEVRLLSDDRVRRALVSVPLARIEPAQPPGARHGGSVLPRLLPTAPRLDVDVVVCVGHVRVQGALPPPHNPWKCGLAAHFRAPRHGIGERPNADVATERGFLATLSSEDRAGCPYHAADWAAIADESVRIVEQLGPRDPADYCDAPAASALGEADRVRLDSLFAEPIDIDTGGYVDGQRRGCALRFSGAKRAAVVVGYERLGMTCNDWRVDGEW